MPLPGLHTSGTKSYSGTDSFTENPDEMEVSMLKNHFSEIINGLKSYDDLPAIMELMNNTFVTRGNLRVSETPEVRIDNTTPNKTATDVDCAVQTATLPGDKVDVHMDEEHLEGSVPTWRGAGDFHTSQDASAVKVSADHAVREDIIHPEQVMNEEEVVVTSGKRCIRAFLILRPSGLDN